MTGTAQPAAVRDHGWIMARVEEMKALGETAPRPARDAVNQPMINNWLEAMGETDPRFTEGLAPPAMAQVWTMYGLHPGRPADDPLHGTMQVLDEAGFASVLGTNCDQTYHRYLEVGEEVTVTTRLESVVGPKRTGVGEGYFVTTASTWRVGEEEVASMLFRVLKFNPTRQPQPEVDPAAPRTDSSPGPEQADRSKIMRPVRNRDTGLFWDGTAAQELRIQKCNACGELRHPPGPMCPACLAGDRGYVVASGRGTVYSFLVHHAPRLPGWGLPLTLALVELEEGVRMVGQVRGAPQEVSIGDPVTVAYDRIDEDFVLPYWEVSR